MNLSETLKMVENLSALEVAEVLSNISQKSGASMQEVSRKLTRVSNILSKTNTCLFTSDGSFRNINEILEDINSNSSFLLNKRNEQLLGAKTSETIEKSN